MDSAGEMDMERDMSDGENHHTFDLHLSTLRRRDRENQYIVLQSATLGSSSSPISCVATPSAAAVSSGGALSREERRRRRRATAKYRTAHATRERVRVEAFNASFGELRRLLPTLPPDKKLSKIEILRLAICYIAYLNHVLDV
ncbi:helix-loop-helix protein 15-like [Hetaerina americana]|uniref:helix-loop-helix protein 15-like n=1 Tax=Hetaerina americana TaxID=62018 RepID=UPI003A7F16D1